LLQLVFEPLDLGQLPGNLFPLSLDRPEHAVPLKLILIRQIHDCAQRGTAQMGQWLIKGQWYSWLG
jgi:hypothetical protein